jgi:hypothetical protein
MFQSSNGAAAGSRSGNRCVIRRCAGVAAAACVIVAATAVALGQGNATGGAAPASAFDTIAGVLQSPRCINCHPSGNRPLQGDDHHPHQMRITRGADDHGAIGARCQACHRNANSEWSMVPGAPSWALAPASMSWQGLSAHALCTVLRDPRRNGNRSLDQLVEHVDKDELVLWGWNPGGERQPVAVPHAEFMTLFKAWAAAGGPCP